MAAVCVAAMLVVRRNAPDGSYFHDGDRAAGVFGVLATGFSVLLGFVVFLAFTSYDASRSGAEQEALLVAQQVETAQFFPPSVSEQLTGQLVCYARSVAGVQWDMMEAGTLGEQVNPWGRVVPDHPDGRAGVRQRAVGIRHVALHRPRTAKPPAATGSTARSASSRSPCGSCCSSSPC